MKLLLSYHSENLRAFKKHNTHKILVTCDIEG